jgi:hypothetical protein
MTPEDAKKLRAPFPPEQVGKLPKAGITLDYVGHAAVTDRLLQVDPSWTWEYAPEYPAADGMWIKLTVCGVTRPGFGDGKNPKEWISDAIRNAAMRFGVALDLWSKQPLLDETTGAPPPRSDVASKIRIDDLRARVKTTGLAEWVKEQHFAWPWENDVCDVIEARCDSAVSK